jgi:amino acid transporter
MVPNVSMGAWTGIFAAAFLAFYAFIGFEDLVNMAEEVKGVRRTLPIAILASVVLTTLLYVMVALVGVLSVPPATLAASSAPIAEIVSGHGWYSATGLRIVSLLAGLNGALVQIVMASRVAYGLAKRGNAPAWLARVNARTRTPLLATTLMTFVVLALALSFGLTTLAKVTSGIILLVYAAVNFSLWQLKRRHPQLSPEGPSFPGWVPLTGAIACTAVLLFQVWLLTFGR